MAWEREILEGGYTVWKEKPKPLIDAALDHLDESYSTRMGYLCQPKKLRLNLRSVVKCRKTEKRERLARNEKSPFQTKHSDYEEPYNEDNTGYEEKYYDEPPQKSRKKSHGLGPAPRKPGMWM